MSRLRIKLIGTPAVELDDAPVHLGRQKTLALLVYLAVSGQEHTRESLAALFWPEAPPERAFANLRNSVWEINEKLGRSWISRNKELVGFVTSPEVWVDVTVLRSLLDLVQKHQHTNVTECIHCAGWLSEASSLSEGEFLDGFNLKGAPGFEDWRFFLNEDLRRSKVLAFKSLTHWYEHSQKLDQALEVARKWVITDPLDEEAHQYLMRLYAIAGQRNAALHQYQECTRILEEELGVGPQDETQKLYTQIRAGEIKPLASGNVPRHASSHLDQHGDTRLTNLPARGTPFIGRVDELAEVAQLLADPNCRLLTLLGPGGVGKTRLALQAAEEISRQPGENPFPSGIFFIPLAHLALSDSPLQAIAAAIGLSLNTDETIAAATMNTKIQVVDFLRQRQVLLVMDNFEQLVDQAPLLSEILSSAEGVKVLVTSRQRLYLQEEWVLEIPGMDYPNPELPALDGVEEFSAPALFLAVAKRTNIGFTLSHNDQPCLARICQMVEGFPLGLELAAAWTRTLSTCEIAQEIARSLDFLEAPVRYLPERQRSLRAVFEHSWKLLSPEEQQVLSKLALFQGGFSRKAAAAVAGASLSVLSSLVDKSLIQVENASSCQRAGCYDIHTIIKQYALEKLEYFPEEKWSAQVQHTSYYCQLLAENESLLKTSQQMQGISNIRQEMDNIRQAWRYATEHGMVKEVKQACLPLTIFFDQTGQYQEASQLFSPALEELRHFYIHQPGDRDLASCLAFLLASQATFLWTESTDIVIALQREALSLLPQERYGIDWITSLLLLSIWHGVLTEEQASTFIEEALQAAKTNQDEWMLAFVHIFWADYLEATSAEIPRLIGTYQKALDIFHRLENAPGIGRCLTSMAHLSYLAGDFQASLDFAFQALVIHQEMKDRWKSARNTMTLGQLAVARGGLREARQYYLESLAIYRELGTRGMIGVLLDCVGFTELHLGMPDSAEQRFSESNSLYTQIGHKPGIAMSIINLGDVALARADRALAQRRYETALGMLMDETILWEKMVCLRKLGSLAAEQGDLAGAREKFKQALWIADQSSQIPEVLDVLVRFADLFCKASDPEKASQILGLCQAHPALAHDSGVELDRMRERLGEVPVAASSSKSLGEIVKELLA